jgi:hypothetical protein
MQPRIEDRTMKASRRSFFQAGAALAAAGITQHRARAENKPHEWQNGRSPVADVP